jgi:sugar lactone lactonase YvrE
MLPAVVGVLTYSAAPTVVGTGFTWAENMWCVPGAGLFVSENKRGELWRLSDLNGTWSQSLHVASHEADDTFGKFCGLVAMPNETSELYALVNIGDHGHVIRVDTTKPHTYQKVATMPRTCLGGGLGYSALTGRLFAASEGDMLPWNGKVYEIDPTSGQVAELQWRDGTSGSLGDPHFTSTDGLFVDPVRGLMYVSELDTSTLIVRNLTSATYTEIATSGIRQLDDFTLTSDGLSAVVASFDTGEIVKINLDNPDEKTTILSNLRHPTSARFGCYGAGGADFLFATEGGDLLGNDPDRTVVMTPFTS